MKPVVGQRVLIANPLKSKLMPDPCFGHVVYIGVDPIHDEYGAIVEIFKPVSIVASMFVAEENWPEALTAVD